MPEPGEGDLLLIEAVPQHWEDILGPSSITYHEEGSHVVHVDMHRFDPLPDDDIDFYTFVTSGMAEKPMNVPRDVVDPEYYRYAELMLHLSQDWPMEWEKLSQPKHFWPLKTMWQLARLPHERETWVWGGHTFYEEDFEPYAPNTGFSAVLVSPIEFFEDGQEVLNLDDGREVVFLTLAFIYKEEHAFCVEHGSEEFMTRVRDFGLLPQDFFVLNSKRPNVCG